MCLHKPWGLNESGPQLAQAEGKSTGSAGLPVCACLCPGGFGCRAEAGQAERRQGWGRGEGFPWDSTWEM